MNRAQFLNLDFAEWQSDCSRIKKTFPRRSQLGPEPQHSESQVHSGDVIDFLNKTLDSNAVIGTDVGAALLTGHFMYEQSGDRRFFTSQGLGEMGFGLPGSIGAYFADPSRQIICRHAGSTGESGVSFPNFSHIANTFGFNHTLISNKEQLKNLVSPLKSNQSELIEITMDPEQKYFPRLATNKLADGSFISPPLEDLDPKIELSLLEELLGYQAHPNSYKARGL